MSQSTFTILVVIAAVVLEPETLLILSDSIGQLNSSIMYGAIFFREMILWKSVKIYSF